MKSLYILIILIVSVCILWSQAGFWEYNKEIFVSNKVLELSVPFDVKINVEFLKSLEPADESSSTSPKGI